MKFGPVPVENAVGAILAHSLPVEGRRIRKGRVLEPADTAALREAGHKQVTVARLEPDDVGEDDAARILADALVPQPVAAGLSLAAAHTGRVNVYTGVVGVLELDCAAIEAANRVDPMITLATLPNWSAVSVQDRRKLVATVKIISYGVAGEALDRASELLAGAMRMRPVEMSSARLIVTKLAEGDKEVGHRAILGRLAAMNMSCEVSYVLHNEAAIAGAISAATEDLVLILTASATSDAQDVAPQALRAAGGKVIRFGMPVDPGNLLFLGRVAGKPVIGLPGCARSPALNGADWVLQRIVCGVDISDEDIAAMAVGGLLKESPARPHPRETR